MSIWQRLREAGAALAAGEGFAALFDRLFAPRAAAPEKSLAFTIAVIALGAKIAKADGQVTRDEVTAFRTVFTLPPGEEAALARVYNLARQDVAGFEAYARQISRLLGAHSPILLDLMEGLFHIALADGHHHPQEEAFLDEVAAIFGLSPAEVQAIKARYVEGEEADPYAVLGLRPGASAAEIRAAWKAAVAAHHPDRMLARGLPPEALNLVEARLKAVNAAWAELNPKGARHG